MSRILRLMWGLVKNNILVVALSRGRAKNPVISRVLSERRPADRDSQCDHLSGPIIADGLGAVSA